ncbi:Ulp1 protease family, C-terminal catalytic domain containing protein, expressed [Panicum miliaceum]|uniref:Ulp1 protease family, C-terminal catalytic domain containing protein, expressed n=1 Tax=Panicum miliaceum TaxID=4540 RepID=A0A3L6SUY3_PANMI|nr:Ulp1 protease family, C-terminal catalytic domain containing protein, expressed [Panicum miliaceum]
MEVAATADAVVEDEEAPASAEKGSDSEDSIDAVSDSGSDSESSFELSAKEFSAPCGKASMRRGCNREKLAGKKRRAGVHLDDSPAEAAEDQQELVEEGQDAGKKKQSARHPNVRCEPNTICDLVRILTAPQREEVKKLGFECLFDFNMDSLGSWDLIVYLMDHLDPKTLILDFGENKKLQITKHTVWCVLGLRRGRFDPPLSGYKCSLSSLRKKLGVSGKHIKVKYLIQEIQSGGADIFTMQCFMMIVFTKLLACTSSLHVNKSVWGMVENICNFGNMNWCKFTLNQLRYSASMWKKPGGRKSTVYGCPAFLVMYYLDNLNCKQKMSCVETPRAKFFGKGMVENLVKADKLWDADGLPTFGNLNLRTQRHTCYVERAESSRHVPTRMSTQGPAPAREASAEFHGEPMVPDVPQGDHALTGGSEDGYRPVPVHNVLGAAEAVQLASTFANEQMRASVASDARTSELEQQVKELTQKLCKTQEELEATRAALRGAQDATLDVQAILANTQEELEVTRATLRGAQATMLEAQSAVPAISSLALRLSATLVRLGDTRPAPSPSITSSSLEEAVKLLEDRVSLIEPMSRGHAMSLARSSVAFVAAALLCRDREKGGIEGLRDVVAGDTRRFVQSQGPKFHSLVAQAVDAVEQQHDNCARKCKVVVR